jgi:hypothetical protein
MPRFVVLEHDHPTLHWDLMLDIGESLRSWRLGALPQAGITTTCASTPDHRLSYLEYEGPVSRNRGAVKRVLAGDYSIVEETAEQLIAELVAVETRCTVCITPVLGRGEARFS